MEVLTVFRRAPPLSDVFALPEIAWGVGKRSEALEMFDPFPPAGVLRQECRLLVVVCVVCWGLLSGGRAPALGFGCAIGGGLAEVFARVLLVAAASSVVWPTRRTCCQRLSGVRVCSCWCVCASRPSCSSATCSLSLLRHLVVPMAAPGWGVVIFLVVAAGVRPVVLLPVGKRSCGPTRSPYLCCLGGVVVE